MKYFVLGFVLALVMVFTADAGIVRLVTPPVVQKAGHGVLRVTKKPRHWVWKVVW